MAEEIKTASAGNSQPVESSNKSFDQGGEQDIQTVEEIETETDGAVVPDEKTVGKSATDAEPADVSDDEQVKKEIEGKADPSVGTETEKVAGDAGKGEEKSNVEEKEGVDVKKADEDALPAEDKGNVTPSNENHSETRLDEAVREDKENNGREESKEVIEENAKGNTQNKATEEDENVDEKEEGELSEGEPANQSESENKGTAGNDGGEDNPEIITEEDLLSDEEETVVGVEPISASSEVLRDGDDQDVADEEWMSWKSEFLNQFNKRFDRKWIISGIGMLMLILGLVIFFNVPILRSINSGEVTPLKEIAGPIYDMKFFLPLTVDSEKERFVKVTLAIELTDKGFRKEIDEKISDLRQEVIRLVLSKSPEEFKSSHAKEMLKKAITDSLNKHFSKHCIKNTYFTELVVL